MKVAVLGAGAVGSVLGGLLARAGEEVTLVGRRRHVQAIRANGLRILTPRGELVCTPNAEEELDRRPDIALVTVKTQDLVALVRGCAGYLSGIPVVLFQNGVRADELAAEILGKGHLSSCVVLFGATYLEPGRVIYGRPGNLVLGEPYGAHRDRTRQIATLLARAVRTEITNDIAGAHWAKLVVNEVNALPAATGLTVQELLKERAAQDALIHTLREAITVIRAGDIRLAPIPGAPVGLLNTLVRLPLPIARLLPFLMSRTMGNIPALGSTLQSIKRGVSSEIDYLNGEIVALGDRLGIATPWNRALVELVHRVEKSGQFVTLGELAERAIAIRGQAQL